MVKREALMTLGKAAERLGLSAGTMRNQAARGRLRAQKVGRDWLVSGAEIERYRRELQRDRRPAE